ncbi:1-acyl-sn-glycerol-3-phosphate acyltransferase [bacterium]|nr:1-acyl-sn-glycerol-3-phosphate acyltransferase [bacterium]
MRFVYSALVWLLIGAITTVFSTFVIVAAILLWPLDRTSRVAQAGVTVWGHLCFRANPRWHLSVRGRERLRAAGACVLCSNHQSQVDILAISALHGQWRWVSKREIFWIPFLGWAMKAIGCPSVTRGDRSSGQRMLEQCRSWLDRGVSILIFPEGTRSEDGALGPFRPGAFKLAIETGRPVLPIVVDGSKDALPKKSLDVFRRADVVVSVLEAIDPAPFRGTNDLEGLAALTREKVARELEALRSPSRGEAAAR